MARYAFHFGRQDIVPQCLARIHPRWQSPYIASLIQSGYTLGVVLLLDLVIQHTNQDGSVVYRLGFADGKQWEQTGGIAAFRWLASIFSMCLIVVYLITNVAIFFFVRKCHEFRVLSHVIAPGVSGLILLLPLASLYCLHCLSLETHSSPWRLLRFPSHQTSYQSSW